jgi:type II secretory pathway predicted ATPase ExeA
MYESFFQLEKSPFGMTPDPNFLMMTESHREALSGLLYALLKRKGFVVLTGEAGTGKTTLLRALMRSSKTARFSVVLNPTLSAREFMELVMLDFGATNVPDSKAQRIIAFQNHLVHLHESGFTPVMMVDEAHKLTPELLEEIRLLTNFETSEHKLIQVLLAGQTELNALLNREDLRQLKQRIDIRLTIKPLSPADIETYLQHRWERAGGKEHIPFSASAMAAIASASGGIPRLVNSICDNALLLAYGEGDSSITAQHVRQVLRDLDLRGYEEPLPAAKKIEPSRAVARPEPRAAGSAESLHISIPTIERYIPTPPRVSFMKRLLFNGAR